MNGVFVFMFIGQLCKTDPFFFLGLSGSLLCAQIFGNVGEKKL